MPGSNDQLRLMYSLLVSLQLADQLGLRLIGCHIDQAIATLERQCALRRATMPPITQSVI